jgi:DIS3-like exonuclease 1
VDRFAMSVLWGLRPDGTVLHQWFGRTIIRSAYKLHYELAQELADGLSAGAARRQLPSLAGLAAEQAQHKIEELRRAILLLITTARVLKKLRTDTGGLQLESSEVRVKLDQHHTTVQELLPKHELEIHGVVAECMIFANRAVGERISAVFPSRAILRRHPLPAQEQFAELLALAREAGLVLDTSSNRALADSLDAVKAVSPDLDKLLRLVATQAMTEAEYFCTGDVPPTDWFHYGLGLEHYTHFTSPIRRYADILAHRLLMGSLAVMPNEGEAPFPAAYAEQLLQECPTGNELSQLCSTINLRNRCSKAVQRASLDFFQGLYFSQRVASDAQAGIEAQAAILQVRESSISVYLPEYALTATILFPREDEHGGRLRVAASLFPGTRRWLFLHDKPWQQRPTPFVILIFTKASCISQVVGSAKSKGRPAAKSWRGRP